MECKNLKIELDTVPSLKANDPYFSEVVSHIESCNACRSKVTKRLKAEHSIKLTMEEMAPLPETLISSVINNTRITKPINSVWRKWGTIAASLFLAVGLFTSTYSYWEKHQSQSALERLYALSIKNHEMYPSPEFFSADTDQVATWLSKRLDRIVKVPELMLASAVEGGRPCALGEYAVGVFHFEIGGKRSTIFSFYPQQFDVEGTIERPKLNMGYTVAVWNENGLAYSLVSEALPNKVTALFARADVTY